MQDSVNKKRITALNPLPLSKGPVIYWISRDARAGDNWAMLYSQETALKLKQPLHAAFCLAPSFLGASMRSYRFLLKGLDELEEKLAKKNIPFHLLLGDPPDTITELAGQIKAGAVVSDFSPLKISRNWRMKAAKTLKCAFLEVDAHNIVPCRAASPKLEYAAYTFRPKINRLLDEFLVEFPALKKHPFKSFKKPKSNRQEAKKTLKADDNAPAVDWIKPGEKAGMEALAGFIKNTLVNYEKNRSDPNLNGQSDLSPYLHFGHLSPQRAALEVKKNSRPGSEAFLEELIVRRELSDNFCFYNEHYDCPEGFPEWAKKSHFEHAKDKREYLYSLREFEHALTHDELWNAAELQMVNKGKMHGYMRMYWAKKILQWSKSPQEALETAIYLNDKYELDGRDPNGYAGIMWSIGGVHDRAWPPRNVFGKIRYMSYGGCKSKFNVTKFIENTRSSL